MNVSNSIGLRDLMTPTLRHIVNTMNMMISNMQKLDSISASVGSDAFTAMRQSITEAEVYLQKMEADLLAMQTSANGVNKGFKSWALTLTGVRSALSLIGLAINKLKSVLVTADEYTGANARLKLINDGLQTQYELQSKIRKAAFDTRSGYKETANLVNRIGMTGAMKTNDDAIDLASKVNKLLKIGGGSASEQNASLVQFSQSLASGVMQGDEFRSLKENAPALMETIAKGLNVSAAGLKQLSSDGELTTAAIIGALEKMGVEIDKQFAAIPVTFGDNMGVLKDTLGIWLAGLAQVDGAFGMLNQKFLQFNIWLSSDTGTAFLEAIAMSLNFIALLITSTIDFFVEMGSVINSVGGISEGVFGGTVALALMIIIPLLWAKVTALWALASAWAILNAPIIAAALAIGIVIAALSYMGVTTRDVLGFVGALFGITFAFIGNVFIGFYNQVGQISVFLQNIFIDPAFAIQNLFYGMISNILSFFTSLINGISAGLNALIGKSNQILGTNFETFQTVNLKLKQPTSDKNVKTWQNRDFLSYSDMASKGSNMATGFYDTLKTKKDDSLGFGSKGGGPGTDIGDIGKVGKVGKIDSDVNIADEDLKMLMDMVVQSRVNQINLVVQSAAPQIINHNNITKDVDADQLLDYMGDIIAEGASISVKDHHKEAV